MSYNGSGTFNINTTGQPVVAGTVISSSAFNALTTDLATGLTTAITKDGQTTTTARITFAQGITSSLVTDSSSISTGSIITDGGMGVAKNLYVGGTLNVTGSTSLTNPVINNIKMGYTTTATAAGTTTLTVASNYRQFFTGTLAQTIVLPVTSTLVTGIAYEIENNSTGLLTVNSSGGNLVGTIPAGVCAHAVCIGTTLTTAADWDWDYISTTTITGTGANVLGTSPTITSPTLVTPALGTPSALVLTNATGLPAAQLTGTQTLPRGTLPTGSVLQVVTYTSNSNASGANTTGTTYYASGFIVTITPSSASSKVLLLCSSCLGNDTSGSGMSVKFYRSIGGGGYSAIGGNALATQYLNNITYVSYQVNMFGLNYLDSPGTTSAVSYQLYFQGNNGGGTGTVYLNGRNNDGLQQPQLNFTAMEISA
jgi:hypothetical protein